MMETVKVTLSKYFDTEPEFSDWPEADRLPLYLRNTYEFGITTLFDQPFLFILQTNQEKMNLHTIKKHIERIRALLSQGESVVLVSDQLSYYLSRQLIRERISFVIPGKQIFILELGTLITERRNRQPKTDESNPTSSLTPSTQALLLYLLAANDFSNPMEKIAKETDMTRMSVSRGFNELRRHGILERNQGNEPGLYRFNSNRFDTWLNAQRVLINPVLKSVFIREASIEPHMAQRLVLSGESALAEHSMLADPSNRTYGITNKRYKQWFKDLETLPVSEPGSLIIQLFKHQLPSEHDVLHPLSIALVLKDEKDERVRKEIDLMINKYFEEV